uniref:Uncharacterized protein n=1 Tax=Pyramimonas orientalis virus TaxID=455367 RepID=A0A7M3UNY5_POV01|nr:hypothetical protein HWQ62_00296 [Pyramimonas orientalis virus]
MLASSEEFVNGFLWKYVDMSITKKEWSLLKKTQINNPEWTPLFSNFKHIFNDEQSMFNYMFVLSNIDNTYFHGFMIFFITNIQRQLINTPPIPFQKIRTIDELTAFIDDDEEKFKMLLISLYYYF